LALASKRQSERGVQKGPFQRHPKFMKTGRRRWRPALVQNLWVVRPDTSGLPIFRRIGRITCDKGFAVEELSLVGYSGQIGLTRKCLEI